MEESEKRRERLKAMRIEASQPGATSETGSQLHHLSNPLVESPSMQTNSQETPRFDYYTDPMAAFSNDKRMSKGSYQYPLSSFNRFPSPRNPDMTPAAHQVRPACSPDPRMYQPRSPHHVQPPYSPNPQIYNQPQNPYYNSGTGNPPNNAPAHWGQSGHFQARPPYHSSYANTPSPSMSPAHQGHSGHFQARPPYHSSGSGPRNPSMSPAHQGQFSHFQPRPPYHSPGSGRGRSGLGRGGNRGFGSHGSNSAELRPDLYYNKSMLEDPWKNLEPSIWKIEVSSVKSFKTPDSRNSLHSDMFGTKKARISEDSKESSSQPSLAEYLAAAFNETIGEESNNNKPNP